MLVRDWTNWCFRGLPNKKPHVKFDSALQSSSAELVLRHKKKEEHSNIYIYISVYIYISDSGSGTSTDGGFTIRQRRLIA